MKLEPVSAELAPYYYRDNFLLLCDTVERQYGDLLLPPELALLACFRSLEFRAQSLYVRLVSRVGPWFRQSRLHYPELGQLDSAIDALLDKDMVLQAQALSIEELGRLFTRAELLEIFGSLLPPLPARDKPSLLDAISALELDPEVLLGEAVAFDAGPVLTPCGVEQVQLLQVLFFGNRRQSLTEFVLSDLGIARYYPYALDREHRLFPDRRALEEYLACGACSDSWYQLREEGDLEGLLGLAVDLLAIEVNSGPSQRRWHRLFNDLARDMERQGELDLAFELYGRSRRHPARERRARVLEAREDWAGAVALCQQILDEPWCEEEHEAAKRILARVQRRLDGTRVARPRAVYPRMNLELVPGTGPVELQAASELASQWRGVYYVENQLMNALFGLAFWEQIFAAVPGAFHNPYQGAPTDMYEADFRASREVALDDRLAYLRSADLCRELCQAYRRYQPYQCQWVNWRAVDAALVEAATAVIPAGHLLAIWERMLFDPRENRRGFPDLIALGDSRGDYCLIEVKGPGDALQNSQKRWLEFCGRAGIPATVAWVAWRDD